MDEGFIIVAAAGNDSSHLDGKHADADMPAAFCGVIAAAAQESDLIAGAPSLAPFSNNPSISSQGNSCIQIPSPTSPTSPLPPPSLVGRASNEMQKAVGVGVCSVYPDTPIDTATGLVTTANPSGLALWDGTSFATAIVSANVVQRSGGITIQQHTPGGCS